MSDKKINTILSEQGDREDVSPIPVVIDFGGGAGGAVGLGHVWLEAKDGRFTTEQGVLLELYDGDLRVIVWADPEQEDPTHIIPIEPMSEEFRKEYERDFKDGGQAVPVE